MPDPFIGEIRLFSFDYAPEGWALCNGQLMSISTNPALYSILGTKFGGDGVNTFALPDLRGRAPVHFDQRIHIGHSGGEETHKLTISEMPAHQHMIGADSGTGTTKNAEGKVWAAVSGMNVYGNEPDGVMGDQTLAAAGALEAHENRQPFIVVNYCICIEGLYPPRD
ncbi:MAG: phage tail protein [Bacillaceae bacterium]|nr:phage tail protein [Bacillaceae bacterium]